MELASFFVAWILWLAVSTTIILPKSRLRCSKSEAYCEQLCKALLAISSFIWFAFLFTFSFANAKTLSRAQISLILINDLISYSKRGRNIDRNVNDLA